MKHDTRPSTKRRERRNNFMTKINWKSEALEFAKVHDSRNQVVIQLIEKAMKHGAVLMVIKTTEKIKSVRVELEKAHKLSAPHKKQTKMIEVD